MSIKKNKKSALSIKKGVSQVKKLDKKTIVKYTLSKKTRKTPKFFLEGILKNNISVLSQAITLIESSKKEHKDKSQEIINLCLPYSGKSLRVGITGVPGVGKSTFIEALGMMLVNKGKKVAVLAIDPSSKKSGGSILGDKTRMEELSASKNAFIRPSPAGSTLGGVTRKTAETIILCEAAGFDVIFVETVGVGQSELAVSSMTDFFLLLMLAGAGDELQGIKRGIMEMADAIVINKADGDNINKSRLAMAEYKNALHLFPASKSGWIPIVKTASAYTKNGIEEVWDTILEYEKLVTKTSYLFQKRNEQAKYRMYETINEELKNRFYNDIQNKKKISELEKKVLSGEISPYFAAKELLK